MTRYVYIVIDAQTCREFFSMPVDDKRDAYLSKDQQGDALRKVMLEGYRWIRTEEGSAIWESTV